MMPRDDDKKLNGNVGDSAHNAEGLSADALSSKADDAIGTASTLGQQSAIEASVGAAAAPSTESALTRVRAIGKPDRSFLPRLQMFSDMPDRGLFLLFAIVGFAGILVSKVDWWKPDAAADYSMYVAVAAVLLMALYGVLAYLMPAVRLRPDRLGDNFYYMGFIYTLASLSAALIHMQSGENVGSLIASFGIALLSTIFGIAGRVVFVQMRTEVEDVEERVRRDLLDAADRLKGQLGAATRDLESFRIGIQQAISERLSESADDFTRMARAQVDQIKDAAAAAVQSIARASEAHGDAVRRIDQAGALAVTSFEGLAKRLDAIEVPPDLIDRKVDGVLQRIDQTATAFERVAVADEARQRELVDTVGQFRKTVTAIATQVRKLHEGTEQVSAASQPAERLAESLLRARGAIDEIAAAGQSLSTKLTQGRQEYENELIAMAAQREAVAAGAADAATARKQIAADLAASRAAVVEAVKASAAETATMRQQIMSDLAASRAAVMEVQRVLAETARVVTEAIRR
jgi:hypothetical protein